MESTKESKEHPTHYISTSSAKTKTSKIKKLSIFSAAKKKPSHLGRQDSSPLVSPPGDTLNKIVSKKEQVLVKSYSLLEVRTIELGE